MKSQEIRSVASKRQIDTIFGALESAGFPSSLQTTLLPEWVTPEVLSDSATSSEIAAILAKRLGLRTSPLLATEPKVESLRRRDVKYKRSITNKPKGLTAATSIVASIAESVASACCVEFRPLAGSADALRREVLSSFPGKWLGLKNLLMTCWSHGLPVVHLVKFGKGVAKMDGTVVYTDSRPVIVLSKASPFLAWQLFILAHEVAHVALGHVKPGEILVDEELGQNSYVLRDNDFDERTADMFAIELLNGRQNATYTASKNRINGAELATAALNSGTAQQIDPGHIALNFAHNSGKWDVGMTALKILQKGSRPASDFINEIMWKNIDLDVLPTDTVDFLARMTGSDIE